VQITTPDVLTQLIRCSTAAARAVRHMCGPLRILIQNGCRMVPNITVRIVTVWIIAVRIIQRWRDRLLLKSARRRRGCRSGLSAIFVITPQFPEATGDEFLVKALSVVSRPDLA